MRVVDQVGDLRELIGQTLGTSDWLEITQERVDAFADATGDHQWIHVDPERARTGVFGGTVAHGYLTLSLIPLLSSQVFSLRSARARLNYGLNRVRFPTALPVGRRVRDRLEIVDVADASAGTLVTLRHTIEIEDGDRPACVAETLTLVVPDSV
jgi:acyl dehydratase